MGFIEETPFLYAQLSELGVPARVWDEVIEEMRGTLAGYGEDYHSMTPPALDQLTFDLRTVRSLDYTRGAEQTDRDYVTGLLTQGDAQHCQQSEPTGEASLRPVADDEQELEWDAYDASDLEVEHSAIS